MRQTIIPLLTASSLVFALGCGSQKKPEPAKEAPAKAEAKDAPRLEGQPPPKPPPSTPADDEEGELPDDPGEDNRATQPEDDEDEEADDTGGVE
jgi:hypothetical protein